jgi:protein SCO1/2
MNPPPRKLPWTVIIGLLLLVMTLALAFLLADLKSRGALKAHLPVLGQVADFNLTNQNNVAVTLGDLRGQVWAADIIFTRCPGPCARMTRQMKELEAALPPESRAKLVSLTTDPEFDAPEVLARYAERFNTDTNRWTFLTGTKKEIGHLAIDSLKLSMVEKKPEERASDDDLFIHSTYIVLVDKHGQLRAVYHTDGEQADWTKSKQNILNAIKQLEHEP